MMALPIDICKKDLSNYPDIEKKIIFCCTKMQNHVQGTIQEYDGKPFNAKPEGLTFVPIYEDGSVTFPQVCLAAEGQVYEPLDYCPFCGTKIEVRPM